MGNDPDFVFVFNPERRESFRTGALGGECVNIPVLVAPLVRVFRLLVFRQIFPWRQVFQ